MADTEDTKQEYSGDAISAMVAAKQRMAERDAEYASKFKQFATSNATPSKSMSKRVSKAAPAPYSNEGRSVPVAKVAVAPYSNEGRSVPAKEPMDASYSNEGRSVPTQKELIKDEAPAYSNEGRSVPEAKELPAAKPDEGMAGVSFKSVTDGTGLRGLGGSTKVPESDQEEFSREFNSK
mgnify:CR=1 FL=1